MLFDAIHLKIKIIAFILSLGSFGYVLVFLSMFLEGEASLFALAFLTHEGAFSLPLITITALLGVWFGDSLWYLIGQRSQNNYFFKKMEKKLPNRFDYYIINHPWKSLFLSKFAYGFHHITLIRIGSLNMNFKKFAIIDYTTSTIWLFTIGSIGYFAGALLPTAKKYLKFGELFIFGLIVLLFFSEYLIKYLWNKKHPD